VKIALPDGLVIGEMESDREKRGGRSGRSSVAEGIRDDRNGLNGRSSVAEGIRDDRNGLVGLNIWFGPTKTLVRPNSNSAH
jgi:hypothetical protein